MFLKSMNLLSKSDSFPSISQSGVDFEQIYIFFLEASGFRVLPSQKYSYYVLAFCPLYDRNVAQTGFLTKYSECDLSANTTDF